MRTWLHLFVRLHKQYFNSLAATYLSRKGLTLDNWLDSVHDGRKGDVLVLLGLCLLIEKHALVHLKGGVNWTSLKNASILHDEILRKVDLHLVYLGQGNFATLQHRANPLQIVSSSADSESVVIGTVVPLSPDESKILDLMIMSGLGVGLDCKKSTLTKQPKYKKASECAASPVKKLLDKKSLDNNSQPNIKMESDTVYSSNILMSCTPVQRITPLCLILKCLDVQPGDRIKITPELLDSIPSNSYSCATNQ